MFERFTDRARKVMELAEQEALSLNHEYIGTEHILLGLAKEGHGVAANVLKRMNADHQLLRDEVVKVVPPNLNRALPAKLPLTPHAKSVTEIALEEAYSLNHNYVGTEHLLLGLIDDQDTVAVQILVSLGLEPEPVREEVLNLLGHDFFQRKQNQLQSPRIRSMSEPFTDRARRVMQLANQEAQRFNHEYIGTEHILLGLIAEGTGVGINVLKRLDVDLQRVVSQIKKVLQSGPEIAYPAKSAQTPRARYVIEYAMEEARKLNHNYVGTEHLLLGLLREQEGVAGVILTQLGVVLNTVREEVRVLVGSGSIVRPQRSLRSQILAYLKLLRLPTVFTALADIFLGFLLTHPNFVSEDGPNPLPSFLLLCAASAGLYLSGMVFNDYFDRLIDAEERPDRPIPSGAISAASAFRLAAALMLIGLGAAACVGVPSIVVAVSLCVLILGYDGGLKKTPLGPFAMGGCRVGNVLLGASAVTSLPQLFASPQLPIAIALGTYIVGVTLFARQEATTSRRTALLGAAVVVNAGVLGLAYLVNQSPLADNHFRSLAILAVILITINRRLSSAISEPGPQRVQFAIKTMLLSLVMLDATLVYAFNGQQELAMATVALLIPALGLSRLIAMT